MKKPFTPLDTQLIIDSWLKEILTAKGFSEEKIRSILGKTDEGPAFPPPEGKLEEDGLSTLFRF